MLYIHYIWYSINIHIYPCLSTRIMIIGYVLFFIPQICICIFSVISHLGPSPLHSERPSSFYLLLGVPENSVSLTPLVKGPYHPQSL